MHVDKKCIFLNFQSDSEVAFMSYARFTVLYCCIGHDVGNYYVNIINRQFDLYYFAKQINWKKYFAHKHNVHEGFCWCKNLNSFGEKLGNEAVDHEMDL